MSNSSNTICLRAIYSGRVQGVGFRWTTARIAGRHPVDGTVRNLADGTVEIIAQGTHQVVNEFLADVARTMGGNIETIGTEELNARDDLAGFEIRP